MKQTGVEYLVEELQKSDYIPKDSMIMNYVINQAKEIETKNINDRLDAIYQQVLQLHNNQEITGFSKRAYAQCLDIVEQFKKK
ncbi:MAG: hypothetical protein KA278_00285 [Flavobacterium sp.]|nr:hypothetical protein [Flavobacterium sp.]